MTGKADGTVYINSSIDTSGFEVGTANMKKAFSGMGDTLKKMSKLMIGVFAARNLINFGKESMAAATVQTEAEKKLETIMRQRMKATDEAIAQIKEYASAQQQLGVVGDEVQLSGAQQLATFLNTTDALQTLIPAMNNLAVQQNGVSASSSDLVNIANMMGKAMQGQTSALRRVGITFSEAEEQMVKYGNEQERAAALAQIITNNVGNMNEVLAKTPDGKMQQLKNSFGDVMEVVGMGIKNFLSPLLDILNAIVAKLAVAANAFKALSELITGNKSESGAGAGYAAAADGIEGVADATMDAADATKEAEKAQKGYLSGLDEISRYEEPDTSGSGTIDAGVGLGGVIDFGNLAEGETVLDKMDGILKKLIDRIKELKDIFMAGFWNGLGDYKPVLDDLLSDFSSIKNTLKEIFTAPEVLASVNRFADSFSYKLGQISGSLASIGLTIAGNVVGGMEKYLSQNKDRIKQYMITMLDIGSEAHRIVGDFSVAFADIFSVFGGDTAQQITGNLIGIFAEVKMMISENTEKLGLDIVNMITQPIIDNKDKIEDALQGTLEAVEPFTSGLLDAVQQVRDAITEIYDQQLKPFFGSVADGLSEIFGKLLDGYNTYIVPVLQGLGEKFQELMNGPFGAAIEKIKIFIGKLIDSLKLLWESVLVPFFSWIADNVMPILAPIIKTIGETVMNVISIIIEAIGNIADVLGGIIDFIVGVFTGDWDKAWNGIKEIFSGIWNLIKGIVTGVWNAIKGVVSDAVDVLRSVISAAWNGIKTLTSTIWNGIKTTLSGLWEGLKTTVFNIFESIKTTISTIWEAIKTAGSITWDAIKDTISRSIENVRDTVTRVIDTVKGTWSRGWETMQTTVTSIIEGIKRTIGAAFQWISDTVGSIIEKINSIGKSAGGITSGLGGKISSSLSSYSINVPNAQIPVIATNNIPYLASGAVIPPNAPFMAVLGDQKHGTNIEAPLSLIEDSVNRAVRNAMGNQQQRNGTYIFEAQLDRRTIFRQVIEEAKLRQTVTGRNPFELA